MEKSLLGLEINIDLGNTSIEIISSGHEIYWILYIIDRNTKEARSTCALNDKTKERYYL